MIERADLDGDRRAAAAHAHEILTGPEAVVVLRLNDGRDMRHALRALSRLVASGRLRAFRSGRRCVYARSELMAFAEREMERRESVR